METNSPSEPGLDPPFDRLPFIDEHAERVAAPATVVWSVLTQRIIRTRLRISEPFARLLGAHPFRVNGTLLEPGSTLPGFAVADAVPDRRLVLTGHHRFSHYALIFTLENEPGGSVLRARSLAQFPGPAGWGYRQLVIGSGGHRVLVGRLVRSMAREAEHPTRAGH
ncbi:hypothetical protein [Frankia gtarii]|uniref:hypothetical protein n=1 Tax=Frankia gtarii TaxID=2950102 RepID=UPI0021BEC88B|nr:hypothetical protein [Frankia gtarii]